LTKFRVESKCELLTYLLGPPLKLSRKRAKDLLRFGAVTVQHQAHVRHDTRLEPGDLVTVATGKRTADAEIDLHGLRIVHLDEAIIVVDKPAGLLSMGSAREKERTAHRILNEYLRAMTRSPAQQAFIVHRLDRETSGLMLFARSELIQAELQQNWKTVTKKYLAIVEGTPSSPDGTLKDRLLEDKSLRVRRVDQGGELAITHYRTLKQDGKRSLLELTLETGRKNQIRVQLAALGNPIVGDRKYGAKTGAMTDPARRLALHSCELSFCHPVSGASMKFLSAMPTRLSALIERRGIHSRTITATLTRTPRSSPPI
jgi:23S rRNA pseudouridine1911/1915/1917 synthase